MHCEIVLRLIKGRGWFGIIFNKHGDELWRSEVFHPKSSDAHTEAAAKINELDGDRRLD